MNARLGPLTDYRLPPRTVGLKGSVAQAVTAPLGTTSQWDRNSRAQPLLRPGSDTTRFLRLGTRPSSRIRGIPSRERRLARNAVTRVSLPESGVPVLLVSRPTRDFARSRISSRDSSTSRRTRSRGIIIVGRLMSLPLPLPVAVDRKALPAQPLDDCGDVRHLAALGSGLDLRVLPLKTPPLWQPPPRSLGGHAPPAFGTPHDDAAGAHHNTAAGDGHVHLAGAIERRGAGRLRT